MPFVLDASTTLSWCFSDERDPYAVAVAATFEQEVVHAPSLWLLETTNALLVAEKKGRATAEQTDVVVSRLQIIRLRLHDFDRRQHWEELLKLAREHGLSAYDATYLHLAKSLDIPLATLDKRLVEAAEAEGVGRFEPNA